MLLSYKLVYYPKYIINCAPKGPGGCPVVAGARGLLVGDRWLPCVAMRGHAWPAVAMLCLPS